MKNNFFVVIYYCTCNFLFRNALATLNVAVYYLDLNQTNVNKLWTKNPVF